MRKAKSQFHGGRDVSRINSNWKICRQLSEVQRSLRLNNATDFVAGCSTHVAGWRDDKDQVRAHDSVQRERLHRRIVKILIVRFKPDEGHSILSDRRALR